MILIIHVLLVMTALFLFIVRYHYFDSGTYLFSGYRAAVNVHKNSNNNIHDCYKVR